VKLEDLLFSLPFPVAVLAGDGRVLLVNQKLESLLNLSEKYLKGKPFHSFFEKGSEIEKKIKEAFEKVV